MDDQSEEGTILTSLPGTGVALEFIDSLLL